MDKPAHNVRFGVGMATKSSHCVVDHTRRPRTLAMRGPYGLFGSTLIL